MIRKSSICFQWTEQREEKSFFDGYFAILVIFFERHFYFKNCIAHEKTLILSSHIIYHVGGVSRIFHLHSDFLWMQQQCLFTRVSRPTPAILLNQIQPNAILVVSLSSVHCTLYTPERPKFNYNLYRLFLCADRKNKKKKLLSYNLFY